MSSSKICLVPDLANKASLFSSRPCCFVIPCTRRSVFHWWSDTKGHPLVCWRRFMRNIAVTP